jgi:hypothetical protein
MAAVTLTGRWSILLALDVSILLPGFLLAGALLLGAAVLALVRRWRQGNEGKKPSASDQLAHFRTLYEQGAISEEEFKRLRAVLGAELRQRIDVPARPAPPASAAPAGQSGPDAEKPGDAPPPSNGLRPA